MTATGSGLFVLALAATVGGTLQAAAPAEDPAATARKPPAARPRLGMNLNGPAD